MRSRLTTPHVLALCLCAFVPLCLPVSAGEVSGASEEAKCATVPDRKLPEPEARGKAYPVPAPNYYDSDKTGPICWGWTCELSDGSGLAFGGIDQRADDGRPHTRVKEGGQWKSIVEELRKANGLQKRFADVWALREACKDALAKARHIYFEGRTAEEEARLLAAGADPAVEKLVKDLAALATELKGLPGLGEYEAGQVRFALKHLEAAAGLVKPIGGRTSPEGLAAMRQAQIRLELAAEAFDAVPPARACSRIAFEPKTKQYVLFGGTHFDYVTNDTWVFDPARRRWLQRHPESAPEPRGDHHLEAAGDGKVAMRGGYTHGTRPLWVHMGPARWIYDVEKNAWTADGHQEKAVAPDSRTYISAPENFMKGPRPDAAAQEAKLKALPANTWVAMKPAIPLGGRDWGTMPFDDQHDLLYCYAGGHSSYGGCDVARYHRSTDRWEISDPVELPLGGCGSNECYPSGVTFNRRPWCRKHVWNSQAYDPVTGRLVNAGVAGSVPDRNFYLYDPDKADWTARHPVPEEYDNGAGSNQLRPTKHGLLAWNRRRGQGHVWLLNAKSLAWEKVAFQGALPQSERDACGMFYDSRRDRMLFFAPREGAGSYDGQIYALDFAAKKVELLDPEGMGKFKKWNFLAKECTYHPDSDMVIWGERLWAREVSAKPLPDLFPAYDVAKNRWLLIRIPVEKGAVLPYLSGVITWDPQRQLFWAADANASGGVSVLRFDPAKAEIAPMKDFVPPAAPASERK